MRLVSKSCNRAKSPAGAAAGLLILHRAHGVHKKNFGHREVLIQLTPPVFANVAVPIRVRLHEDQPAALGRLPQFVADSGRAVFLLRRHIEQHIAVWQQLVQTPQVRARSFMLGRVGVRAIEDHNVSQNRRVDPHEFKLFERDTQRCEVRVGMSDEHGQCRRRTFASRPSTLTPDQGIHQSTFTDAGSSESRHDQRRFQPYSQCFESSQQPSQNRLAMIQWLPRRVCIDELAHVADQLINLSEQFNLSQFGVGHGWPQWSKWRRPLCEN